MSVLENVMIAHHCRTKEGILSTLLRTEASKKEEKMIQERALETLKAVGLDEKKGQVAKSLPYGEQRLLEMARALSTEPDLILLDEPSAGMNRKEATWLMERIENIRTQGITIILVEHNMRLVMNISHRVTVLDFGEKIAEGTPEEIKNNSKVIEAYLGKKGDHART
jgi:branched-chain amino acid transport system ATP-binding protein